MLLPLDCRQLINLAGVLFEVRPRCSPIGDEGGAASLEGDDGSILAVLSQLRIRAPPIPPVRHAITVTVIRSLSQGLLPTRRKRESVDVGKAPSMTACIRNSEYEATMPGVHSECRVSCVRDLLQVGSKLLDRCVADSRNPSRTYLLTQSGNEGQKQFARCTVREPEKPYLHILQDSRRFRAMRRWWMTRKPLCTTLTSLTSTHLKCGLKAQVLLWFS